MLVRVLYITENGDVREFEYASKFDRINAKGIKEEIENKDYMKYGKHHEIKDFYRI